MTSNPYYNGQTPIADEMRRTLQALFDHDQVIELRSIDDKKIGCGYFDDHEKLISEALQLDGKAALYVAFNRIHPGLIARYRNRFQGHGFGVNVKTTSDTDVIARRWYALDFDPARPSGIPASDEEYTKAHAIAQACREWFRLQGSGDPIYADSGNGAWLFFALDEAEWPEGNDKARAADNLALLKRVTLAVKALFERDGVKIDETVVNAARIGRLFGSSNAKGDGAADRQHRPSRLIDAPARVPTPRALVQQIADVHAPVAQQQTQSAPNTGFDIKTFMAQHLQVTQEKQQSYGMVYLLAECPFCHLAQSSITVTQSGAITFQCKHQRCNGKRWQDVRELFEPGCYNRTSANTPASNIDPVTGQPWPTISKLLHANQLGTLPPTHWLIDGFIATNKLSQLFAPPGSGKSFVAEDIAHCVGQFAPVVYVAAEAVEDYEERAAAWCKHHNLPVGQLYFWTEPVQLASASAVDALIAEILPLHPALVIIDPLASCMVGLEESSTGDMTKAVDALNRIRTSTGAGILIVHHTGWSDEHERGSSVLRGACRVVMKLSTSDDGLMTLTCAKANNGKPFEARHFRLEPVGQSAVPIPSNKMATRNAPLSKKHIQVLEALDLAHFRSGASQKQIQEHTEIAKSTVNQVIDKLITRGYISHDGAKIYKLYSLTPLGNLVVEEIRNQEIFGARTSAVHTDCELAMNWTVNLDMNLNQGAYELAMNSTPSDDAPESKNSSYAEPLSDAVVHTSSQAVHSQFIPPVHSSVHTPPLKGCEQANYEQANTTESNEQAADKEPINESPSPIIAGEDPIVTADLKVRDSAWESKLEALKAAGVLVLASTRAYEHIDKLYNLDRRAFWEQEMTDAGAKRPKPVAVESLADDED